MLKKKKFYSCLKRYLPHCSIHTAAAIVHKLAVADCFCRNKTLHVAHTFFSSKDTDRSRNMIFLTKKKRLGWELSKLEINPAGLHGCKTYLFYEYFLGLTSVNETLSAEPVHSLL